MTDDALIIRAAHLQIALGLDAGRNRECHARLCLRHIGARHLADPELVVGCLQLAPQYLLIVDIELYGSLVAHHVEKGLRDAEQHLLLGGYGLGALREHVVLGLTDQRRRAAAGPYWLGNVEIEGPWREV